MELKLTDGAQLDRDDFNNAFKGRSECTCFISPPCCWCIHPGNPRNQEEDDSCWVDDDAAQAARSDMLKSIAKAEG